jgi:glucuronokinase
VAARGGATARSGATASAFARAALAGNPSDGYGGATLAVEIRDFCATVEIAPASAPSVSPPSELVSATVSRFTRELAPAAEPVAIEWSTSIPRAVGLGGSSAIVVATLRALCSSSGVQLSAAMLAEFALAVEMEELGIAAGLQDRVAQAYGGLTFMDFSGEGRYEPLSPDLLPPLFLAWREDAGGHSGEVHRDLRARHARGEPDVTAAMIELSEMARSARDALLAGDRDAFARHVDGSFDVRLQILPVDYRHVAMIGCARQLGASANSAGSGGAIVGTCTDERHRDEVVAALAALGCGAITPQVLAG